MVVFSSASVRSAFMERIDVFRQTSHAVSSMIQDLFDEGASKGASKGGFEGLKPPSRRILTLLVSRLKSPLKLPFDGNEKGFSKPPSREMRSLPSRSPLLREGGSNFSFLAKGGLREGGLLEGGL